MKNLLIITLVMSFFTVQAIATEEQKFSYEKVINLKSGPATVKLKVFDKLSENFTHKVWICKSDYSWFKPMNQDDFCDSGEGLVEVKFVDILCSDSRGFYSKVLGDKSCSTGEPRKVFASNIPQSQKIGTPKDRPLLANALSVSKDQQKCLVKKVSFFKKYLSRNPDLENWFKRIDINFNMYTEEIKSNSPSIVVSTNKVDFNIKYGSGNGDKCLDVDYLPLKNKLAQIKQKLEEQRVAKLREANKEAILKEAKQTADFLFNLLDSENHSAPKADDTSNQIADSETPKDIQQNETSTETTQASKITKEG